MKNAKRVEELLLIEDIKQAIAEKDVDKAEKLLDELNTVRKETEALAESLLDLEAGNPFSKWPQYFESAKQNLKDLYDTLAKQQLVLNELMSSIALSRANANANVLQLRLINQQHLVKPLSASRAFAEISSADAAMRQPRQRQQLQQQLTAEEKGSSPRSGRGSSNAYVDATSFAYGKPCSSRLSGSLSRTRTSQ
jgi:hypothetical protein